MKKAVSLLPVFIILFTILTVGAGHMGASLPAPEDAIDWTQHGYDDPFNNSLFSVLKEFEINDEEFVALSDFAEISNGMMYDEAAGAMTYHPKMFSVNYAGETQCVELMPKTTDRAAVDEVISKAEEENKVRKYFYDNMGVFNDGIAAMDIDGYFSLCDINKTPYYTDFDFTGTKADYNIGLLYECSSPMGFSDPSFDYYNTRFTKIMTNGESFEFRAYITCFNDEGYALMHIGTADTKIRHYVVRLKAAVIPTVWFDGEKMLLDTVAVNENGRILVPVRAIFEKIGAEVLWDDNTKTVTATKGEKTVSLTIDSTKATVDGEEKILDVPAKIINGRTMVPVRFVSESFGISADWDTTASRVLLQ